MTTEFESTLAATGDYIYAEATDKADSADLETLLAQEEALVKLSKQIGDALTLIRTGQTKQLEAGSRQIGNKVYARVGKYRHTWHHNVVQRAIREFAKQKALNKASGEFDLDLAVDYAVQLTADTYTSASTKPKVGMTQKLGLLAKDVSSREKIGYEVKVVELEADDDDE